MLFYTLSGFNQKYFANRYCSPVQEIQANQFKANPF